MKLISALAFGTMLLATPATVLAANATPGKWYVVSTVQLGFARVDNDANPTQLTYDSPNSYVDSYCTANGENPGNLLSNRQELGISVGRTAPNNMLFNTSDTYDSEDSQAQGYHYARFESFALPIAVGQTRTLYMVVRKSDAGGAGDFQSDLYLGLDKSQPYLERDLAQPPYNLARASVAFRSMVGNENLTCLWTGSTASNGTNLPAASSEFTAVSAPQARKARARALTVPAKPSKFQLIKIVVTQTTATSGTVQAFAYSYTNFSDTFVPANWQIFAQTAAVTVTGAPGTLTPYFSATKVPAGIAVDNGIFAMKYE